MGKERDPHGFLQKPQDDKIREGKPQDNGLLTMSL